MTGVFVDYLDVSQQHGEGLPDVVSQISLRARNRKGVGGRLALEAARAECGAEGAGDGVSHVALVGRDVPMVEACSGVAVEGSYSSTLTVKCHRGRVRVAGNPSRFGRADNLFGFSLDECMQVVNARLGDFGLPPFTPGRPLSTDAAGDRASRSSGQTFVAGDGADVLPVNWRQSEATGRRVAETAAPRWSGAAFARIDITRNYATGSELAARLAIRSYQARAKAWAKKATYGEETAMWHTSHLSVKAYRKGPDMRVHCPESEWADWADQQGIVRHEVALKSRYLSRTGLRYWGNLSMGTLHQLFEHHTEVLRRPDASLDPLAVEAVPRAARVAYALWLRGEDCRTLLPRRTLYRHRRALLDAASIDIAEPRVAGAVAPRVKVIELVPAAVPAGYQLWAAA